MISVDGQVRGGVLYVAAGSDPAQFGQQLGTALQLVEQLPNPIFLAYDYVLHIAGGAHPAVTAPVSTSEGSRLCFHAPNLKALSRSVCKSSGRIGMSACSTALQALSMSGLPS